MKNNAGNDDSELREFAKKLTKEELLDLAEELERRAAIFRQISCDDGFHSSPFLFGHLRWTLGQDDQAGSAGN